VGDGDKLGSMKDDQIDDLKQFIKVTVSQSEARLESRLGGRIDSVEGRLGSVENRLESLEQKMDDGFAGIAEAIEFINDQAAVTDRRLTKLEQKAA
jgi:hypothetical protein